MMIKVEPGMMRDLGAFCSLEIKAQDYPLPQEALKCYIDDPERRSYLATIQGRKVGVALTQIHAEFTTIARVSVHPEFRNLGISKKLMFEIERTSWKSQHRFLRIYIPHYKIDDPYDPDHILWWLEANYFKAVACETRSYFRYGTRWDAYVFERAL